ncbi:MFS transporter [Botrimarina sp.]|uniref:MFS transporter n=1 Tax=Botrimarina sp. TaxID=2795802 RepID=UPI0032EABCE7
MRRALAMASLIVAGEAIFIPPFHLGRYFKSSLLGTFGINELELGEAQAVYGAAAMVSYVIGGPIADRFAPRTLIAVSLLATGAGSVYMATVPGLGALKLLFGFWGVSTILVFWAPLIRATREWGGQPSQGRAFGLLDAGRGLVAALAATAAAQAVALWLGSGSGSGTLADAARQRQAVVGLSLFYAACCAGAAVAVWLFVGGRAREAVKSDRSQRTPIADTLWALRQPAVWLQALVVVAAYSTYKAFSFFGLFAEDVCGLERTESSKLVAYLSYLRVGAALAAGLLADWVGSVALVVSACFAAMIASFVYLIAAADGPGAVYALVVLALASASAASYALRGVYFALLEESGVPRRVTGAAVGIVSVVGFTPDIYMPWLSGWLVASARQTGHVEAGYQQLFVVLAASAAVGLVAAQVLRRRGRRRG